MRSRAVPFFTEVPLPVHWFSLPFHSFSLPFLDLSLPLQCTATSIAGAGRRRASPTATRCACDDAAVTPSSSAALCRCRIRRRRVVRLRRSCLDLLLCGLLLPLLRPLPPSPLPHPWLLISLPGALSCKCEGGICACRWNFSCHLRPEYHRQAHMQKRNGPAPWNSPSMHLVPSSDLTDARCNILAGPTSVQMGPFLPPQKLQPRPVVKSRHPLSCPIETPATVRGGGGSRTTVLHQNSPRCMLIFSREF